MRYFKPRRNKFRSNDKGFRRNDHQDLRMMGVKNVLNNHQRKSFGRNGQNAEKLLEKYNSLAKEALSNGDKILSESYYQHADHFLRIVESKNLAQSNPKQDFGNSGIKESSRNENSLENTKNSISQNSQNTEEV